MTDFNVHVHELSDKQLKDIDFLMSCGYFKTKSSMVRTSLLLLVLFVRYTPKTIFKLLPGGFNHE